MDSDSGRDSGDTVASASLSFEDQERLSAYFNNCEERRSRFHEIMENRDSYKARVSKQIKTQYTLNGDTTFCIESKLKLCQPFKKEPAVLIIETLMPGNPDDFIDYWGSSHHRLKWESRANRHEKRQLSENRNSGSTLHLVHTESGPVLGGVITPRQYTSVGHTLRLDDGLELVSTSVSHADYPPKKGLVEGDNVLHGHRIRSVDSQELKDVYNIPELKSLSWVKCQCVIQTNIKGWLPKKVVDKAICGGSMETFDLCRRYILGDILGHEIKAKNL